MTTLGSKEKSATDADVDGLHIRNLLITYFFKFFEQVVHDGHLYVLETPLFRVRNKQETIYCYSEAERDAASAKLGKSCEITRFKGLGEISPKEFQQFIGKGMKLSQVEYWNSSSDHSHVGGGAWFEYLRGPMLAKYAAHPRQAQPAHRRDSGQPKCEVGGAPVAPWAMTPPNKSKAASGICWWIPWAWCSAWL